MPQVTYEDMKKYLNTYFGPAGCQNCGAPWKESTFRGKADRPWNVIITEFGCGTQYMDYFNREGEVKEEKEFQHPKCLRAERDHLKGLVDAINEGRKLS